MYTQEQSLYLGQGVARHFIRTEQGVAGEFVTLLGEPYDCIRNYDQMPPFFMSVVSSTDHWLFISSTGGLTAGRRNADVALFPYYTVDKITENAGNTGHCAILHVEREERTYLWQPFQLRYASPYRLERNLYKNLYSSALIFEEINHDLGLRYRYAWRTSDTYGFVKSAWLTNVGDAPCTVRLIDGLRNLLPHGATTAVQTTFSNLLDAYKRNELEPESGLGIFGLSSTLTDLAEPSEALKASTVWQVGLEDPPVLLSERQLPAFVRGAPITPETDVRGRRGAYLAHTTLELPPGETRDWHFVAEVDQDSVAVVALRNALQQDRAGLAERLARDIASGDEALRRIVATADGLQRSGDRRTTAHHRANVLFNVMRGGVFADHYTVERADLLDFVATRNQPALAAHEAFFADLPPTLDRGDLLARAVATESPTLIRLCYAYLPITFSRRHGDPSRPWNQFSINVKKPDGSQKLDYQGNWRDIFQNWQPLACAYPEFVEHMITTFLSATTADGYNPYRVTRDGIEWEVPNPEDPWANIGYWSDHQIIYLQKLLELSAAFHPGALAALLERRIFAHANVPYRIKPYADLLEDSYDTIDFDRALHEQIEARVDAMGTDGKLVLDDEGQVVHVNLAEKLLILLLAKLANFVPEGGIWMNTQRPEWNDANNALVGRGLSVVTLCYLRRFVAFCRDLVAASHVEAVALTRPVKTWFEGMRRVLEDRRDLLREGFDDVTRRTTLDALGQVSSDYRWGYYREGVSEDVEALDAEALLAFLDLAQAYIEHSLRANVRPDALFHAYNVLTLGENTASVGHLYEMLEGQVAALASGLLDGAASLALLRSLRHSRMYRADQHSYMLYPDRDLPGFLEKNRVSPEQVADSALVAALDEAGDTSLLARDEDGVYHFNGAFTNARDVRGALDALRAQPAYAPLVEAEADRILELFEDVFHHAEFTGRSGTFFAYEGLGSIYWHMVSKLLLAVQETYWRAVEAGEEATTVAALAEVYHDVRRGLSFNKPTEVYGAFPADPYSHTPAGQGAKQPGMTGLVKEEILARWGELGVRVADGALAFEPRLLRAEEFTDAPATFDVVDVEGRDRTLDLPAGALAYTFCQVPVVYRTAEEARITVHTQEGDETMPAPRLSPELSDHIVQRDGYVRQITVYVPA
jgi:hypothetical protein